MQPSAKLRTALGREATRELSRDEIFKALEHEIITAHLQPGERVDERAIAARFSVSRAPVRDAIGRLASLGMIDVRPRSGSYVTVLTLSEVLESFEVMSGLEGLCAFYAAQRLSGQEQAELRQCCEDCLRSATDTVEQYIKANLAFHAFIYKATRNNYLQRLTRQARQRVGAYRNVTLRLPGRQLRSAEEHLKITDAICRGDYRQAQCLMADHADIKRDDFAPFIRSTEERPFGSSIS